MKNSYNSIINKDTIGGFATLLLIYVEFCKLGSALGAASLSKQPFVQTQIKFNFLLADVALNGLQKRSMKILKNMINFNLKKITEILNQWLKKCLLMQFMTRKSELQLLMEIV